MSGVRAVAVVGGVGVLALLIWRGREAVEALNPANPDNLVNRAATAALRAATGDATATIGTRLYDLTHATPGPLSDQFRAVGGVPIHRAAGLTGVIWRAYSFAGGRWNDAPAPSAAAWANAPALRPGFVQLFAAGRPWHY